MIKSQGNIKNIKKFQPEIDKFFPKHQKNITTKLALRTNDE